MDLIILIYTHDGYASVIYDNDELVDNFCEVFIKPSKKIFGSISGLYSARIFKENEFHLYDSRGVKICKVEDINSIAYIDSDYILCDFNRELIELYQSRIRDMKLEYIIKLL